MNWHFHIGHHSHSFLAWLSWYGSTRFLQKALFSSPFVIVPTFIGEVEQDYYYWPFVYKKKAEHWRETTTWGQHFKKYQFEGCLAAPQKET